MNTTNPSRVLLALFDLARGDRPATVDRLAARLALSADAVRAGLAALERAGLADAMRVRLTLPGLAWAAAARCNAEVPRSGALAA
jgi:predicted ArsR family transcriptional regulator